MGHRILWNQNKRAIEIAFRNLHVCLGFKMCRHLNPIRQESLVQQKGRILSHLQHTIGKILHCRLFLPHIPRRVSEKRYTVDTHGVNKVMVLLGVVIESPAKCSPTAVTLQTASRNELSIPPDPAFSMRPFDAFDASSSHWKEGLLTDFTEEETKPSQVQESQWLTNSRGIKPLSWEWLVMTCCVSVILEKISGQFTIQTRWEIMVFER